jgi:hypothetical protein
MVMHLSPGHTTGTLVNALLGHCKLGPLEVPSGSMPPGGLISGGGLFGGKLPQAPEPAMGEVRV